LPPISMSERATVFSTCDCVTVVIVAQYTKRPSQTIFSARGSSPQRLRA
jgi:hypothetical protein